MRILGLVLVLAGVIVITQALIAGLTESRGRRGTTRTVRSFGPFERGLFSLSTIYVFLTVLSSPVKGLANQGDYERLTIQLGVGPVRSQPYSPYVLTYRYRLHESLLQLGVPRAVAANPRTFSYYFGYHSSELLLARLAIGLHGVFAGGSTFDIRWLGVLNALLWLGALASLFVATRQLSPAARGATEVLFAIAFTDFGYVEYFNSFFSEPAEIGFLLLAFGLAACVATSRRPLVPFVGFVVAAVLGVSAKVEDAILALPLALVAVVVALRRLQPGRERLGAAVGATVALLAAGLIGWLYQVPFYSRYQLYNAFFDGILRTTQHPRVLLRQLGLSPSLARYAGYATDDLHSAFAKPFIDREFFRHVSSSSVAGFYLGHPGSLLTVLSKAASQAYLLRPPYGNLPGPPTRLRQYGLSTPWTLVHRALFPHTLWFIALVLLVAIATSLAVLRRAPRAATPEVLLGAALVGGTAFVQAPVGGGFDGLVKHMVLFNVLSDLIFIVLLTSGAEWLWHRYFQPGAAPVSSVGRADTSVPGGPKRGSDKEDLATSRHVDDNASAVGSSRS